MAMIRFFMLFLLTVWAHGQQLLPPVYNYQVSQYLAGSKNWSLAVNERGELFVANNQGLLYFNGEKWTLYRLPNHTIIRSVAVVGARIYTGSYEEFGYWTKDEIGVLHYESLTHLIKNHSFTSEDFWEILPSGDAIYLRTFAAVYVYRGDRVEVLDPDQVVTDIIEFQGGIVVATEGRGLYGLQGSSFVPLPGQQILEGESITDMVVWTDRLVVGTKLSGCYIYDGQRTLPLEGSINEELKLHQLNKLDLLSNGQLAFGTIKNGVYLWDPTTDRFQVVNRGSGLQNNTVLSILPNGDQLWLGLDNGIGRVKLDNPVTYFTDTSGGLGLVYDMAAYEGTLYLGSNTGVYYFEGDQLRFVQGSQGHVWDLEVVDGDLLCGHNSGTYLIEGDGWRRISDLAGGYELARVPDRPLEYLQGTYSGLALLEKRTDRGWTVSRIGGVDFPIKQLSFESPRVLWAAHPYRGLYRIRLSEDLTEVEEIREYHRENAGLSEYNVRLYKVRNQLVFYSEGQWHRYDPIRDEIREFEEFRRFRDQDLLYHSGEDFWFIGNGKGSQLLYTDLAQDSIWISDPPLRERLAPDSQKMVRAENQGLYVGLNDGFAHIDLSRLNRDVTADSLSAPQILLLRDEAGAKPVTGERLRIAHTEAATITVEVASPALIQARYRYRLSGPRSYTGYTDSGFIQFQNLPHGAYRFEVSTLAMDNAASPPVYMEFQIGPPFLQSGPMVALYFALGIALLLGVRAFNRRKLERRRLQIEERLQREQEEKMAEIERDKLERELRHQQNELALTTLNIARKNEMMLEIKNMLLINKDKFSNMQRYHAFLKKLDESVSTEEDWKRFEINFNELHQDFFTRLLGDYPKLTPKDLKLCAYLKMNLSSKEIAPLMGISTRGVEIHRYRLRKKLGIDANDSLSSFLVKL